MKDTVSCVSCHNRKVKCDRKKPVCSTCSKRGTDCYYEDKKWKVRATQRVKKTRKSAAIFEDINSDTNSDDDEIDFYSNTFQPPVSFSEGPLTWVSFAKKDRFLNIVVLTYNIKNNLKVDNHEHHVSYFENIKKLNKGFDELVPHRQDDEIALNDGDLINNVEKLLSNSKIVWISIEKFFESEFYMFFPLIDKDDFIEKLVQLIGPPNYNGTPIKLTINKSINFAYIGILLIIIRLTSLSYYNFGKSVNPDSQTRLIMFELDQSKNVSSSIYHNLLSKIYLELSIIKPPVLQIFQFICMNFSFELCSPDEYDCLNIANCSKLGELIQYAIQCSLNRDPALLNKDNNNNSLYTAIKNNNLRRRLWYMIICFDFLKNVNSGYPLLIDETTYNTELPIPNSADSELDYILNSCLIERINFFDKAKPVLRLILNMKQKPKIKEFNEELVPFLNFIKDLQPLDLLMKVTSINVIEKSYKLKSFMILISANTLLYTVYYHLFIFYSEMQSVPKALYYLIELMKIIKVLYEPLLFIDPNRKDFNLDTQFGSPILSFPTLESGFHKVSIIFFGILSRIKALKISKGGNIEPSALQILDKIVDIISKALWYMLHQLENSSKVYFHTWLLSKVHTSIVMKILRIPKGVFLYSDLTEADINFKQALSKTAGEVKTAGDLGFEKFSTNDLKKILEELKGLEDIYKHESILHDSTTLNNYETITENDQKWVRRMLRESGHGLTRSFNISRDHNNSHNKDLIDKNPDNIQDHENILINFEKDINRVNKTNDNLASLESILNGSEFDNLLDFEITSTFFGFNDNGDNYCTI